MNGQKAQRVESSAQNINLINVGYENIIRKKRRRRNVIGDWPSAIQKRKEKKEYAAERDRCFARRENETNAGIGSNSRCCYSATGMRS